MRRLAPLSCVLAVAACAAPNPQRPDAATVSAPVDWRTALPGTVPITADWWQGFGDPVLSKLVETALANNVDIAIATARVREARAGETLARAALFPTLDAGVGGSYARSVNAFGQGSDALGAQPIFQTAYEIDLFGRIGDQIAAARANSAATLAARDAAALSVAAATASGYISLRALDARRAVVQETIMARAQALHFARSRAEAGYTSQLELRQAEAEYQAAAQILPQTDLSIARQEHALSLLLGDTPRAIVRGVTLAALTPPAIPEGLPSDLLRRRPDIAQAEYALAASDATLAAARAQYLPSVRLTGSLGATFSNLLTDPISVFSIGGSVLAPLSEGGRLRAGVATSAARRDQAAFAYRKAAITAFREVEDALAAVTRLAEQDRSLAAQRVATAEALRHATNRYRAGYGTYLEQLDAQRSLLAVDLSLVQLRADQLNARVALYQAMGGGWNVAGL